MLLIFISSPIQIGIGMTINVSSMAISTVMVQIFVNALNAQDGINRNAYRIFGIIGLLFSGSFFLAISLNLFLSIDKSQIISIVLTFAVFSLQIVLPWTSIQNNEQMYQYVQNYVLSVKLLRKFSK